MPAMPANSVLLIVTDPPCFIDGMGDDWDHARWSDGNAVAES